MMLAGKGYYIWQIARTEGGNVTAIADMAVAANLQHILIKIADGTNASNVVSGRDLVAPLVSALKARGIEVWGWHYVYGANPQGEADIAIQRIQQTGVVGYSIDAETYYKDRYSQAVVYMNALRRAMRFFPIGLSSYRYPTYHPNLPWEEFLSQCDFAMPQVYWMWAHNPREQLARTLNEYRALTTLPVVPTGSAYSEGGWTATTSEVIEFLNAARDNRLSGANFWEWYSARQIPGMWDAIKNFSWPPASPQPPFGLISRGRVNTVSLNIRMGPGTNYGRAGSLRQGTRVSIYEVRHLGVQQEWVKISPDRDLWVLGEYLDRVR